MYQPKIHDQSIRRLYAVAKKLEMPMTKLVNLIVTTALEELEALEADDLVVCEPVRTEEPDRSEKG
jgi:hypothetical protein